MFSKHQGDVVFHAVEKTEGEKIKHNGSFILAYGEKTGHKHVVTVEKPDDMRLYQLINGDHVLELFSTGTVTHEEHLPIILQPGIYKVSKEREYDWFSKTARQVID